MSGEVKVTLKPCPFCGSGPAKVVGNASFSGVEIHEGARGRHYVQCGTCGASALGSFHQQAAIDNWNTRTTAETEALLKQACEALERIAEHCANAGLPNEIVADRVVDRCDETARTTLAAIRAKMGE